MNQCYQENVQQARAIVERCNAKRLVAAVNFQLRYAPYVLAARHLIVAVEANNAVNQEALFGVSHLDRGSG